MLNHRLINKMLNHRLINKMLNHRLINKMFNHRLINKMFNHRIINKKNYYTLYINYHKYINLIGQWVKIRIRDHTGQKSYSMK